jgi:hypothetical protein
MGVPFNLAGECFCLLADAIFHRERCTYFANRKHAVAPLYSQPSELGKKLESQAREQMALARSFIRLVHVVLSFLFYPAAGLERILWDLRTAAFMTNDEPSWAYNARPAAALKPPGSWSHRFHRAKKLLFLANG